MDSYPVQNKCGRSPNGFIDLKYIIKVITENCYIFVE